MSKKILGVAAAAMMMSAAFAACGDAPCVAGTCTFKGGSWNETCDVASGCSVTATDDADVKFSCPDGSCSMNCEGAKSCVLDCPGGSCALNCATTATCKITACANACSLNCGGAATCESSCGMTQACTTNN